MIVFVHKNLSKSFVLHRFEMLKVDLLVELINPELSLMSLVTKFLPKDVDSLFS